jgi:hypothetical protein
MLMHQSAFEMLSIGNVGRFWLDIFVQLFFLE